MAAKLSSSQPLLKLQSYQYLSIGNLHKSTRYCIWPPPFSEDAYGPGAEVLIVRLWVSSSYQFLHQQVKLSVHSWGRAVGGHQGQTRRYFLHKIWSSFTQIGFTLMVLYSIYISVWPSPPEKNSTLPSFSLYIHGSMMGEQSVQLDIGISIPENPDTDL